VLTGDAKIDWKIGAGDVFGAQDGVEIFAADLAQTDAPHNFRLHAGEKDQRDLLINNAGFGAYRRVCHRGNAAFCWIWCR